MSDLSHRLVPSATLNVKRSIELGRWVERIHDLHELDALHGREERSGRHGSTRIPNESCALRAPPLAALGAPPPPALGASPLQRVRYSERTKIQTISSGVTHNRAGTYPSPPTETVSDRDA